MQIVLSMHDLYDMLIFCAAKLQIISYMSIGMGRNLFIFTRN